MAPLKSSKRQRIHATDAGNTTKMRRKRASARNATKSPNHGASSTGDEPLPSLPEELIFEILFRVPVKSLIRFKCVSKSWEALISDPKFAKNHLRTSSADPNATHQQLLSSVVGHQEVLSFSLHALFRNPKSILDKPLSINMSDKYHILGSCNGLLCVCDIHYRYVILWNPATKLTSRRFPTSLKPGVCLTFHGFGYDDLNDKYKLLVVEGDLNLTVTKVLTFGENSWKVIPNFRRYCPTEWQGKFVNGTLHWLSQVKVGPGDKDRRLVFSFDLRTETYNAMVIVFDGIDQVSNLGLNVLRNCLSFCFFDCKGGCWVIWSMKEYGVNDSCTIFMKIPHMILDPCRRMKPGRRNNHGLFASGLHHPLNLVCISDDGVLIFKTEFCQMVLYEPKNRRCTFINHTCGDVKVHQLQVYQESLVSPLC